VVQVAGARVEADAADECIIARTSGLDDPFPGTGAGVEFGDVGIALAPVLEGRVTEGERPCIREVNVHGVVVRCDGPPSGEGRRPERNAARGELHDAARVRVVEDHSLARGSRADHATVVAAGHVDGVSDDLHLDAGGRISAEALARAQRSPLGDAVGVEHEHQRIGARLGRHGETVDDEFGFEAGGQVELVVRQCHAGDSGKGGVEVAQPNRRAVVGVQQSQKRRAPLSVGLAAQSANREVTVVVEDGSVCDGTAGRLLAFDRPGPPHGAGFG